jgi:hypothetical protein
MRNSNAFSRIYICDCAYSFESYTLHWLCGYFVKRNYFKEVIKADKIIRSIAILCVIYFSNVLLFLLGWVHKLLLLVFGPLGFEALWINWIVLVKTILLFILMGMLSYVHFKLQPKIESFISDLHADSEIPDNLASQLKPFRVKRKWMATFCLFLVITAIILGLQVYSSFNPILNIVLIGLAGLFALKVNKTLMRFGWI